MIKVPCTLFFLEAVISFSKAPHLMATQTFVLSGILFDGHFIPQNWSILEFQQSKLAASIAFVADIFCWILLKSHTLFFEHTSRFSSLTSLKSDVFFVDCAQIGSAPPYVHTIFQQVTFRERIGSKRGLDTNESKLKRRGGGGRVSVYILSRVSIKTSSLLVSLNIQQTGGSS